jgi:hypothetical protein
VKPDLDVCIGEGSRRAVVHLLRLLKGILVKLFHQSIDWTSEHGGREGGNCSRVSTKHDVFLPSGRQTRKKNERTIRSNADPNERLPGNLTRELLLLWKGKKKGKYEKNE